ncbi:MAG: endonuclease/exonuclease/phosphatase family protein [Chlorobi bacterium]|nr:endonuclease/exonuclease/phosphatase family protein [Chlorobiota bacterium]
MKLIFKMLLWVVITVVVLLGGFLLFITIKDYQPPPVEVLMKKQTAADTYLEKDTFNLISWNIGYAGLGKEMDFFYDGGKKVRPTKALNRKYFNGIKKFISGQKGVDFLLIQEVDIKSKRSHRINEVAELEKIMPEYTPVFAINYNVPYVPVPVYEPMGSVKSGLLIFSKYEPEEAKRFAYPLIASWPNRLFLLDRCFILARYRLMDGKELVIINTHNSAYVYDSALRVKELQIIKNKMIEEYNNGNYVIAGGDWNANPPDYQPEGGYNGHRFVPSEVKMSAVLLPEDWKWAFDPKAPTNRQNDKAFIKGENGTTCLDYFVVSPNVEVLETKTIDLSFENSDHNPVFVRVALKK